MVPCYLAFSSWCVYQEYQQCGEKSCVGCCIIFQSLWKLLLTKKHWIIYLLPQWWHVWNMWWKYQETKIKDEMISLSISWWKGYNELTALYEFHLPSSIGSVPNSSLCEITKACLIREQGRKNGFLMTEKKGEIFFFPAKESTLCPVFLNKIIYKCCHLNSKGKAY